ncbi:MAG: CaiB/BaiF CoA-transferase family protein [Pseudomonadota bacterium]
MSALKGLRVLDLSRVLAGPWAGQLLADLGASVVKVERPDSGDDTRAWGPPYMRDDDGAPTAESAYYLCANRGKRSITIDITSAEGQARLRRLAASADVLLENFKFGGAAQYGLDYESLREVNPGLVYCSITGFGQTGPLAARPGYDFMIQALGGLMSITGAPDEEAGAGPQKVGVALTDIMTGLYATVGVLAALREREQSGLGQHVDLALLDVTAASLANQATNYLVGGLVPGRLGNAHPNIVPYQTFRAADREFVVAVGNEKQFSALAAVVGEPSLSSDERFNSNGARVKNRKALCALLEQKFAERTAADWLEAMEAKDVPSGPINRIDELFAEPQLRAREMIVSMEHPENSSLQLVANPIKLSRTPVRYDHPPPRLGEHDMLSESELWDSL